MYLIRLDDASEYMNIPQWSKIQAILESHNVKPLVGIIPLNRDPMLTGSFQYNPFFWDLARSWQVSGWGIALHGYEHVYSTKCGGINPIHTQSEFAGHTLAEQQNKIRQGLAILHEQGLFPTVFFAPSHTFDENTLEALRTESNIRIISDTVANDLYCHNGFTFIPQQSGRVRKLPFKLTTICLHPNYMSDCEIAELEAFLKKHSPHFIDPSSIAATKRRKNILDYAAEKMYFFRRKFHSGK